MKRLVKIDTLSIPVYWAAPFVNADPLLDATEDELTQFQAFCEAYPYSQYVLEWNMEEYFTWKPSYYNLGCTCVDVDVYKRMEVAK